MLLSPLLDGCPLLHCQLSSVRSRKKCYIVNFEVPKARFLGYRELSVIDVSARPYIGLSAFLRRKYPFRV